MPDLVHDHDQSGLGGLIPLQEQEGSYWVDARLLHVALGSGTRFSDWIARRLADTLATEGEDFYSDLSKTPEGGRPATQYRLTVDLAKEVAMLERTKRGKAIRRYFIEAERALREGVPLRAALPAPAAAPALPAAVGMDFLQQFAGNVLIAMQQQAATTKDEVKAELRLEFTQAIGDRPISGSQPLQIQKRIRTLAGLMGGTPAHYSEAWRRLKSRYGVASYRDITVAQFDDVIKFLDLQIASYRTGDLFEGGAQ